MGEWERTPGTGEGHTAVIVTLSPWEFKVCVELAVTRIAVSASKGLKYGDSQPNRTLMQRLEEETVGACGEMAFAKAANTFWSPSVNTFHRIPDVGDRFEVRATTLELGSLIVRDNDDDDRWYVLVTGQPPKMNVVGMILGREAKQDKWVRNPNGHRQAWFVPQNALRTLGIGIES